MRCSFAVAGFLLAMVLPSFGTPQEIVFSAAQAEIKEVRPALAGRDAQLTFVTYVKPEEATISGQLYQAGDSLAVPIGGAFTLLPADAEVPYRYSETIAIPPVTVPTQFVVRLQIKTGGKSQSLSLTLRLEAHPFTMPAVLSGLSKQYTLWVDPRLQNLTAFLKSQEIDFYEADRLPAAFVLQDLWIGLDSEDDPAPELANRILFQPDSSYPLHINERPTSLTVLIKGADSMLEGATRELITLQQVLALFHKEP